MRRRLGTQRPAPPWTAVPTAWPEASPPLLARWVFSDHLATRLVPPLCGDASGVRGAAWLWGPDRQDAPGG